VQRNAMRAYAEGHDFKELLLSDAEVGQVLSPPEVERAFDLSEQFRHVDAIFDRVFSGPAGRARAAAAAPATQTIGQP
jgi:adenylosuccinate lyase